MSNNLPISLYKDQIVGAVKNNSFTIISAETGSGKSTQVCQYLYEAGYEVIVTQPRRLAAVSLANRVAEELGENGGVVAYHTGFESTEKKDTSILFCTDGLQLVRELSSRNADKKVIIIDEAHEWNVNIDTLIAWCKKCVTEGTYMRVVVMSATLDHKELQQYLGNNTPVIQVPGKLFPVELRQADKYDFVEVIMEHIKNNQNVLAFLPGKREIEDYTKDLIECNYQNMIILPLHGELSMQEQQMCFKEHDKPKVILATNIAQTSVTIADIDAVVDSGTEKQMVYKDGIQGLFLFDISQADAIQRKGRAGRTKKGVYTLCSSTSLERRPAFSIPEIQRTCLDQVVLRLAAAGIDATELDFFHQPDHTLLNESKAALELLGALKGTEVTTLGKKMVKMPISAKYARMILTAEEYGVVDDVITIAAILEVGSLLDFKTGDYSKFTKENTSDLLAELDTFNAISEGKVKGMLRAAGINPKNYYRVKELKEKLLNSVAKIVDTSLNYGDREQVKKACVSGMLNNMYKEYYDFFSNDGCRDFKLDNKSCLNSSWKKDLVVAIPRTIQFEDNWGYKRELDVIAMATTITTDNILELAPDAIEYKLIDTTVEYVHDGDTCMVARDWVFKGIPINRDYVIVHDHHRKAELKDLYEQRVQGAMYGIQKTVIVDGMIFQVESNWRQYYVSVTLEQLFKITKDTVKLDDGRVLNVKCNGRQSENVACIKDWSMHDMAQDMWQRAEYSYNSERSNKKDKVLELLTKIGSLSIGMHPITGDEMIGYVGVARLRSEFALKLFRQEEEAKSATNESVRYLFDREVSEKFGEKKFKKAIDAKNIPTRKYDWAFKSFTEYLDMAISSLTVETIEETLLFVAEAFQECTTVKTAA